jgi:hypothetical protein
MHVSVSQRSNSLPRSFPVGAKYVVEGYGGENGDLQVSCRYVVLPDGKRINLPADGSAGSAPASARRTARDRSRSQGSAKARSARAKKILVGAGTAKQRRR